MPKRTCEQPFDAARGPAGGRRARVRARRGFGQPAPDGLTRREILQATLSAGLLSACSGITAAGRSPLGSARAPKQIIVIGAGLAGLVAGWELHRAGHHVTILEAQARPGGRVYTLRDPFSDGLYVEAGAHAIPDIHTLTLGYVRAFGLRLDPPMPPARAKLYYARGQRILATRSARIAWPYDLTPEEAELGPRGMWQKYMMAALDQLGDPTTPDWPAEPWRQKYEGMSLAEFLRAQGASPDAIELLRVVYAFDVLGDGAETDACLLSLRDLALTRNQRDDYTIAGGNDRLPRAFAERLSGMIHYGAPVVRIEWSETTAGAVVRRAGEHQRFAADYAICTIPFSVLRHVEVAPPLSPPKRAAIEQLPYASIARVYLQSRQRFWAEEELEAVNTDLPIKWLFDITAPQRGPRGVLEADAVGAAGRRIGAMSERERIDVALDAMELLFPGRRALIEVGASKCWDEDPWARGAYAYFRPGQMRSLQPHIARPEGRIHFAGDHTSAWMGWIEGALESGLRAAREVHEAT